MTTFFDRRKSLCGFFTVPTQDSITEILVYRVQLAYDE